MFWIYLERDRPPRLLSGLYPCFSLDRRLYNFFLRCLLIGFRCMKLQNPKKTP